MNVLWDMVAGPAGAMVVSGKEAARVVGMAMHFMTGVVFALIHALCFAWFQVLGKRENDASAWYTRGWTGVEPRDGVAAGSLQQCSSWA